MRVERRILLGEPDGESRAAIARALRADGHEVEEAANGADLLLRAGSEMACVHGPRAALVLIVAAGLPVFSGSEVLEILHRLRWNIPCVIISSAPDGVEHTRARELGAVAVLGSPLRMEQLRGILRAQAGPRSVAARDVVERVRAGAVS